MPHILLIDDDDLLRPMLREQLQAMGHTVTEARDGKEGLARQKLTPADLVLTDLVMPEKEGVETIKELKKTWPTLPIVAMSGGGRANPTDYLKIAKLMGAARVLTKPFSNDELTAVIRATLDGVPG